MARVPNIVTPLMAVWAMYRRTERGVKLFTLFVVLFAVGLLLMLAGHPFPAAVCDLLAFAMLLAMVFTTPPHVLDRRLEEAEAAGAATEEVDSDDENEDASRATSGKAEVGERTTTGRDRSELDALSLEAETAPTSRRREIKPPPEVPQEVVTTEEGEEEEGGPSTEDVGEGEDKDLWI